MNFDLVGCTETGPYDFHWWADVGTEHFDRTWECTAVFDGRRLAVRHGIGSRVAYGRPRTHSVTWLEGQPIVEGVEADDYPRSRSLLSAIKLPTGKLARTIDEIPSGYEPFQAVDHRSEIDAPYSRRALAVKIREDDLKSWVDFALLRARDRGRLPSASDRPDRRATGSETSGDREAEPAPRRRIGIGSPGLIALLDLENGVDPVEFSNYLRLYERETDYDRSLRDLRRTTGDAIDLQDPIHRGALLGWLRAWGCRHLRRQDTEQSSAALLDWAKGCASSLPSPGEALTELSLEAVTAGAIAFGELALAQAASRARSGNSVAVRFGPTAAAKALFATRPEAFAPWDDPIREALGFAGNDCGYRSYLLLVARSLKGLANRVGVAVDGLPETLGRPDSSPPKLIDEYLWIRISRGLRA